MKNYLGQALWLTLLVLLFLAALSLLPPGITLNGVTLRKMDIFLDIRESEPTPVPADSTTIHPDTLAETALLSLFDSLGRVRPADASLFGKIVEDYTPDQQGLSRFFDAVDAIRTKEQTVRVAFFGDSFIEGDILLGDLRDTLQTLWGGNGVGYVPITSEVARFKRTLTHEYSNWKPYSIVKNFKSGQPFGINGFVYRPKAQASVRYEGADYFKHTRRWTQVRLFYRSDTTVTFTWQMAEMSPQTDSLPATGGQLGIWLGKPNTASTRTFDFQISQPDSNLLVYGATLESGPGIYLDNFSVRGNTGGRLKLINPILARQFDAVQQYQLIVVQLGLNAATPSLDNIGWYEYELDQTFQHIRKCFPETPVLIVSVADRGGKIDGNKTTLPSVPVIATMQRELARKHGFLFFDLFHAMGGPGSMIRYADEYHPPLANLDYTHLTHYGGSIMGYMFTDLFLREQEQYRQKKKQQPAY
ncbi:MAG: hypothetical protein EP344_01630 [Bacteroidetes bacterium]|nr:MAG: hypothetical protein EP344_01630 [Bacteroidota bacterium]